MPTGVYQKTPKHIEKIVKNLRPHKKGEGGWKIKDTSNMKGRHPKSEFKKGDIAWNKGLKGYGGFNKGKKVSEETRGKLSRALRGHKAWNKGMYGLWSGEKNPNWRGGYSKLYRIRRTREYDMWRTSVFERDNYICQNCGNGDYITAHHIKSIRNYPELALSIENGLTLCEDCHTLTDNYKGKAQKEVKNECSSN